MTPQLDKAMRQGGMSRRGFLRAMGVTAAAVLVPGLGTGLVMPNLAAPLIGNKSLAEAVLGFHIIGNAYLVWDEARDWVTTLPNYVYMGKSHLSHRRTPCLGPRKHSRITR